MDTLVLHTAIRQRAVALADNYASAFITALPKASSEEELQAALAGLLLTYLAEVAGVE